MSTKGIAGVAALALVAAACSSSTGSNTTTEPEPAALDLTATEFEFTGIAEEMEGGAIEIRLTNDGEKSHNLDLFRIEGDVSAREALQEANESFQSGKGLPEVIAGVGGVPELEAGDSATVVVDLTEGDYAFLCTVGNHAQKGMLVEVEVSGDNGAALPETDASVNASEYTFDLEGIAAGTQTVKYTNEGQQPHFVDVVEYAEGVTATQVAAEVERFKNDERPQLDDPVSIGGIATLDPGEAATGALEFQSGRVYAFACFLPDRAGGPPHAFAGMYVPFEVE